jgi:hypothetical protein
VYAGVCISAAVEGPAINVTSATIARRSCFTGPPEPGMPEDSADAYRLLLPRRYSQ